MTRAKFYNLAWRGALAHWAEMDERAKEQPGNHLAKYRAEKAWRQLLEVETMYKNHENDHTEMDVAYRMKEALVANKELRRMAMGGFAE